MARMQEVPNFRLHADGGVYPTAGEANVRRRRPDDDSGREALVRYCAHPCSSLARRRPHAASRRKARSLAAGSQRAPGRAPA